MNKLLFLNYRINSQNLNYNLLNFLRSSIFDDLEYSPHSIFLKAYELFGYKISKSRHVANSYCITA